MPSRVRALPDRLASLVLGRASRLAWMVAACVASGATASFPAWTQSAEPSLEVITLAPHITEMVFAAGAGHTLVGTVISSDYPVAARTLPKVGDGVASISVEKIAYLAPGVVLAWQESGAVPAAAQTLDGLHIPVEYLAPHSLDEIPEQIEALGKRLGTGDEAKRTAGKLRAELQRLRERYSAASTVSVFIEVGDTPLYAAGSDAMLNDALRTCGGSNVFANSRLAALPIGPEQVLRKRPEVIIVAQASQGREQQAAKRWAALGLDAASGTRVHGIDPDMLFRPGPRLIDATRQLCEALESARQP